MICSKSGSASRGLECVGELSVAGALTKARRDIEPSALQLHHQVIYRHVEQLQRSGVAHRRAQRADELEELLLTCR